jgi:hypothetical protein
MKLNKIITFLILIVFTTVYMGTFSSAYATYESYTYNEKKQVVPAPVAYDAVKVYKGADFGTTRFNKPQDLLVDKNRNIYIVDTGNNRIVILNSKYSLTRIVTQFKNDEKDDKFNSPSGIFKDDNGKIYITDTGNKRILVFTEDFVLDKVIGNVASKDIINKDFEFLPVKVAVDKGKRLYVVAKNVYDGLMEFNSNGDFKGFIGSNKVNISMIDYFWKTISTKSQAQGLKLTLPTEFSNVNVDIDGFVYTTTSTVEKNSAVDSLSTIRRQNPSGQDILKRNGVVVPAGDIEFSVNRNDNVNGPSRFVDVTIDATGRYSALDSQRGRVFTYDSEGNLLYVFGSKLSNGQLTGNFNLPVAIDLKGDNMLVLDGETGYITEFSPTEYGRLINSAVLEEYDSNYDNSARIWKRVLELNSNYEMAYTGIANSYFQNKQFKMAMDSYKLANNRTGYSKAYKSYRNVMAIAYFKYIFLIFLLLVVLLIIILKRYDKKRDDKTEYKNLYLYPLYLIAHPFEAFYCMKFQKRGRISISIIILAVFTAVFIVNRQFTGFIFNYSNPESINIYDEIMRVAVPFILWIISNCFDNYDCFEQLFYC